MTEPEELPATVVGSPSDLESKSLRQQKRSRLNGAGRQYERSIEPLCHLGQLAQGRLNEARRQGRLRLLRLRGPTLSLGFVCLGASFALMITQKGRFSMWYFVGALGARVSTPICLLSLLPTDSRCIPASLILFVCPMTTLYMLARGMAVYQSFTMAVSGSCVVESTVETHVVPCWYIIWHGFENAFMVAWCALLVVYAWWSVFHKVFADLLCSAWWLFGMHLAVITTVDLGNAIISTSAGFPSQAIGYSVVSLGGGVVCFFTFQQQLIRRLQSWLLSRGEAATTAAGISYMLAGRDVDEVLESARNNFVYVTADRLTPVDMANSTPDPALAVLTEKGMLGDVDAFISHSWHDNAEKKWKALQGWVAEFKRQKGREPRLWIDKYSIDQKHIDESLACLPVYLVGCKQLVVLCGSTYLQRLWCMVELFVFLEMGGQRSNLELIPFQTDDRKSVQAAVAQFDVKNAKCFKDRDTTRLQCVLESSGCDRINNLISEIFTNKGSESGWAKE